MTYKILTNPIGRIIVKIDDNGNEFFIPEDPNNADYQAYLEWLAEGNEPEPWNG